MNFCEKCDNMYYMKVDDKDVLVYYCRNCGNEKNDVSIENLCVSTYEDMTQKKTKINEFTKYDPTLPHSHTIKCPNPRCKTNTGEAVSDVIYIRVDDQNMNYIYLCTSCDYNWKP